MAINFIAQQAGRIVAHANRFLVSELRRRGVTDIVPSHGDILNYLLRHDGGYEHRYRGWVSQNEPTVTVLVDKLIAAGYVERRPEHEGPAGDRSVAHRKGPRARTHVLRGVRSALGRNRAEPDARRNPDA